MRQDVGEEYGRPMAAEETWPGSAQWAFVLSLDFDAEEVWIGEDPANANRPGVLSQGRYGPNVAVPLLLEMFARLDITATFFVPGKDAERHPDSIRSIVAAGHEVAHHGYTHRSPDTLSPQEEADELQKGIEVLTALGAEVVGYRSPSWDFSAVTPVLLEQYGFMYTSNLMDDIRPYRHAAHDLVELPVHWVLDDAPHFWFDGSTWTKTIRLPREVRELWQGEAAGIRALGGLVMLTVHPFIIGRPGRLAMLEEFLRWVQDDPDVWVATAREVAARWVRR
jgi:peptidoglycan/xylan/chitin deacetylase (PgdA/CDA1 family)